MTITVPRCPARQRNGRYCSQPAGRSTSHPGYGSCVWHHGAERHVEEIWDMAHEAAAEQGITPHEALISLVEVAAGRVAWVDTIIREAMREHVEGGGDPLKPPKDVAPWLKESRLERTLAARTAKAAVDAGVMVALERRLDMEGQLVADALSAALDVLGLDQDQRMAALGAAQQRLLTSGDSSGTTND
ncbi:hypothetical protein [Streptomyces iconiensis]|uniref:Uncharacterized protein n=1 Tax=Streptomyces iconiensis TaxID=1384038 RepID=A0ABT7ABB8_9ACTN|nr:hypothetical protein [Streptomyces iconiensis]MDJ1137908.1 hypothetical protein [Streptomyces iconiensis]